MKTKTTVTIAILTGALWACSVDDRDRDDHHAPADADAGQEIRELRDLPDEADEIADEPISYWGRYLVHVYGVTGIPPTDSLGEPWDPSSYPDPYAVLYIDGAGYRTHTIPDTLDGCWDSTAEILILPGAQLVIEVWDDDSGEVDGESDGADDPIAGTWDEALPIRDSDLRRGYISLEGPSTTITIVFERL